MFDCYTNIKAVLEQRSSPKSKYLLENLMNWNYLHHCGYLRFFVFFCRQFFVLFNNFCVLFYILFVQFLYILYFAGVVGPVQLEYININKVGWYYLHCEPPNAFSHGTHQHLFFSENTINNVDFVQNLISHLKEVTKRC